MAAAPQRVSTRWSGRSEPSNWARARSCLPQWTATAHANLDHLADGVLDGHADAVLAASIFHFGEHTVREAKRHLASRGITVRP